MSGTYLRRGDGRHHCRLPQNGDREGTLWECDECRRIWVVSWQTHGTRWFPGHAVDGLAAAAPSEEG